MKLPLVSFAFVVLCLACCIHCADDSGWGPPDGWGWGSSDGGWGRASGGWGRGQSSGGWGPPSGWGGGGWGGGGQPMTGWGGWGQPSGGWGGWGPSSLGWGGWGPSALGWGGRGQPSPAGRGRGPPPKPKGQKKPEVVTTRRPTLRSRLSKYRRGRPSRLSKYTRALTGILGFDSISKKRSKWSGAVQKFVDRAPQDGVGPYEGYSATAPMPQINKNETDYDDYYDDDDYDY